MPIGRTMTRWKWYCVALLFVAICASAQSPSNEGTAGPKLVPRSKAAREERYVAHHRILLNVQITDASGHPVIGLNAHDLVVQINRQPETITSFQEIRNGGATAHAHAFFVVDMLNNSAYDLAKVHKALERLAGGTLPVPTSLVVLTETGTEVKKASTNAEELATELEKITKGFHLKDCTEDWNNAALGTPVAVTSLDDVQRTQTRHQAADRIGNCLNEKYQLSFTSLLEFARRQQSEPGRAILVWIGPGWPILSGPGIGTETPYLRESFFRNLVNASTELREGQVTLDAVSWPTSSPVAKLNYSDLENLMGNIPAAAQASAGGVAMPVVAHRSGGQVYTHEKDLAPELAACLADANSYYVVGFDSAPSTVPDEFRAIKITVNRPGVTVRTNTGYYAQP
jgi:VWFA-related protein